MASQPPLPVIVNRSGGTASAAGDALGEQLRQAFASAQREVTLHLVEGKDLAREIERHGSAERVVVGGGDGTLATGAQAIAARGGEMAILPLGTRNHFARQLGIPVKLEEAAALAARGRSTQVDLGDAGGRVFLNNASVGAYPELVRRRKHLPLPKGPASVLAGWRALAQTRSHRIDLRVDGESRSLDTPLLFVGNNRYEINEGHPGERACLTDGQLSVFALRPLTRWKMLRAAVAMLFGAIAAQRAFAFESLSRELVIEGPLPSVDIALDGEAIALPTPLTLSVRKLALRVVAPEQVG